MLFAQHKTQSQYLWIRLLIMMYKHYTSQRGSWKSQSLQKIIIHTILSQVTKDTTRAEAVPTDPSVVNVIVRMIHQDVQFRLVSLWRGGGLTSEGLIQTPTEAPRTVVRIQLGLKITILLWSWQKRTWAETHSPGERPISWSTASLHATSGRPLCQISRKISSIFIKQKRPFKAQMR